MQTPPPRNEAPSHRFAAKLSPAQAEAIRGRYLSGEPLTRLAAELGVSVGALSRLVNHHTYRDSAARIALKLSADNAAALDSKPSRGFRAGTSSRRPSSAAGLVAAA